MKIDDHRQASSSRHHLVSHNIQIQVFWGTGIAFIQLLSAFPLAFFPIRHIPRRALSREQYGS